MGDVLECVFFFSLTHVPKLRRNETVPLGQESLGTEGEAKMALYLQKWTE